KAVPANMVCGYVDEITSETPGCSGDALKKH
ncbi:hypothetical protein AVEN_24625-1, partial [Araneus ventricosus]